MLRYAQISEDNTVEGITYPAGEIDASNVVKLDDEQEVNLGDIYDSVTGTFISPPPPELEPEQSIEPSLTNEQIIMLALADIAGEIEALKGDAAND